MRLLNNITWKLKEFMGDDNLPPYAILSHTWGDDEVTCQDITSWSVQRTKAGYSKAKGYSKIKYCCTQAFEDGLEWSWIDTCCIDKTSSAELSEAINSMFRWYQKACMCYAYLADVLKDTNPNEDPLVPEEFSRSRWFTRGWTLQELVAPKNVVFYSRSWKNIGTKEQLCNTISTITGIDIDTLLGEDLTVVSVANKMSWASGRRTT
ncbi:HET-domain-containing protein [Hyaloscypha variabilis F]|uniref:HET-domain-containing protein n=1 Tax=Hyaloscypha variabilis (strain UAMH 11265 / GT02V1 / F) TaxID=1149755 RepID=A0A2J6R4A9_HYAVF|nr:HET-domain-containing protein [Hyaloscypha variabilis F]